MRSATSLRRVLCLALPLALFLSLPAGGDDSQSAQSSEEQSEFARFVKQASSPASQAPPASPDTCEANQNPIGTAVATLSSVEQLAVKARARQAERWKEKGWTAKQAAAAGESVPLNGSGYNYRPGLR